MVFFYYDPISEFDRLFGDVISARVVPRSCALTCATENAGQAMAIHRPRLDIYESKESNAVIAAFELPGLTAEGVTIDIHQNRLTVSGEWPTFTQESESSSNSQEEGSYVVRERRSGKFSRTLQLPFGTKPEDVIAKMENGVLSVTFPKTSPEQQPKRVVIQTSVPEASA